MARSHRRCTAARAAAGRWRSVDSELTLKHRKIPGARYYSTLFAFQLHQNRFRELGEEDGRSRASGG